MFYQTRAPPRTRWASWPRRCHPLLGFARHPSRQTATVRQVQRARRAGDGGRDREQADRV